MKERKKERILIERMKERKQEKEKERKKERNKEERKKERKIPANCRVDQLLVIYEKVQSTNLVNVIRLTLAQSDHIKRLPLYLK
jgi:hypothetical protein